MTDLRTSRTRSPKSADGLGSGAKKPRLAFFRPDRPDLPAFVRRHLDEHVACLSECFEVVLVEDDCDYDEVCDRTRPELALFESGVYVRPDRRITNTHRHPEIPKLGLLNADAYCHTRSVFLSDMDEWGVETLFSISMSLPSRAPELRGRLYVWPNFADARVFRSYPGTKTTPLLLTGSRAANYPWRSTVNRLLGDRFPVEAMPHGGWSDSRTTASMVHGEPYARALSSALIVPTCGTIAHELVRKHLEVPAAGALLLTERTAAVEAAGFVDMETCVFAEETDVVDKVEYLLAHPDEIARISAAGQRLAHDRHDMKHRNQLLQWHRLALASGPDEVIAQPDVFGDLVLQPRVTLMAPSVDREVVGLDMLLMASGDAASSAGRLSEARSTYLRALNYHYEPEAALGLARTCLRSGDAREGDDWVWSSIMRTVSWHRAAEPDPVEWSVHVLALLCQGRVREALDASRMFDRLDHLQLARIRRVLDRLTDSRASRAPERVRSSIHQEPLASWVEWVGDVAGMLDACGQPDLALRVEALKSDDEPRVVEPNASDAAGQRSGAPQQRRIGRRLRDPRRSVSARVKGRLARLVRRSSAGPSDHDPLAELLSVFRPSLVVTVGLALDDPVDAWVGGMCRRSPEPCTLVRLGTLASSEESVESLIAAGTNPAIDVSGGLPVTLSGTSLVVVGGRAVGTVTPAAVSRAGIVILTGRAVSGSPLALGLDADPHWARVVSATLASGADNVAWGPRR